MPARLDVFDLRRPSRAAVLAAFVCAASPAAAADRLLSLEFEAFVGGISALNVGVEAGLRPDAYAVDFRFATRGMVAWVVGWTMSAHSRGAMREGVLLPASAGTDSAWNGKKRTTRLDYKEDGSIAVELAPRPEKDDRDPVPPALMRDTLDLSGAILSSLEGVTRDGSCARRIKVYDGRRRYDLVIEDGGTGTLGDEAPSVYKGKTLVCRLSVDQVAGFQKRASRVDWATGDTAAVHLARVFPDSPMLPVMMEYETDLGLLRAYLTGAAFTDGERQQRLAVNREGKDKDKGKPPAGGRPQSSHESQGAP